MSVGWIYETAIDRFFERGSSNEDKVLPVVYPCRVCRKQFQTISERDQHEISHPISNPSIYIDGKEVGGDSVQITTNPASSSVYLRHVQYLAINGEPCKSEDDFVERVSRSERGFLDVEFGNGALDRRLKISICIADPAELTSVDEAFIECFLPGQLNGKSIVKFRDRVSGLRSVRGYSDGLFRYVQGVMAKDRRADVGDFEEFAVCFNQASTALRNYETQLSDAVCAVINFSRNDFSAIRYSGVPQLDSVIEFFRGGGVSDVLHAKEVRQLPVDSATELILSSLFDVYDDSSLEELAGEVGAVSPLSVSQHDKLKFDYICWRKSVEVRDGPKARMYQQRLRLDDAFCSLVDNS